MAFLEILPERRLKQLKGTEGGRGRARKAAASWEGKHTQKRVNARPEWGASEGAPAAAQDSRAKDRKGERRGVRQKSDYESTTCRLKMSRY